MMRRILALAMILALALSPALAEDMPVFDWADDPEPVASIAPPEISFEDAEMMPGGVALLSGEMLVIDWHADGDARGYRVEIADDSGAVVRQVDTPDTQYCVKIDSLAEDQMYTVTVTAIPSNGTLANGVRGMARFVRVQASTPEPTPEPTPTPTPKPECKTVTIDKETAFSAIRVEATVVDGKIVDAKVTSKGDIDLLTDDARMEFAKQMVEKQDVDIITGVTISSEAIKEAVAEILHPSYSATSMGFGGEVTVTLGFDDDGNVAFMTVDTPNETDGIGMLASEPDFAAQFIGKKGPFTYGNDGIEAVTGATFTSKAVIDAVNTIVMAASSPTAR